MCIRDRMVHYTVVVGIISVVLLCLVYGALCMVGAQTSSMEAFSNGGSPVIVIGVPVRYIHSHYGFAAMVDYENCVKLAVEIIKRVNDETIKSF